MEDVEERAVYQRKNINALLPASRMRNRLKFLPLNFSSTTSPSFSLLPLALTCSLSQQWNEPNGLIVIGSSQDFNG